MLHSQAAEHTAQMSEADFTVDLSVLDELRGQSSAALDNIGALRGLLSNNGTTATGSQRLGAHLQELTRSIDAFCTETSTNLALDRDGLAQAQTNYEQSDSTAARISRAVLNELSSLPLPTWFVKPALATSRVTGPADRVPGQ